MACEVIEYRGYHLHIDPEGAKLRVSIEGAGHYEKQSETAHSEDMARREQLIAESKALVDALIAAPNPEQWWMQNR
jgi:hypothetical protein